MAVVVRLPILMMVSAMILTGMVMLLVRGAVSEAGDPVNKSLENKELMKNSEQKLPKSNAGDAYDKMDDARCELREHV